MSNLTHFLMNAYSTGASDTNGSGQQLWGLLGDSIANGRNDEDLDIGPQTIYTATVFEHVLNTGIVDLKDADLANSNDGSQWKKAGMDFYKYTGHKMVFSNGAVSGSSFFPRSGFTDWSSSGVNRALFQTKMSNGLNFVGVGKMRGVFMHMGINDAFGSESLASIETAVHDFFNWFHLTYPTTHLYVWNIGFIGGVATSRVLSVRSYIVDSVAEHTNAHIVLNLSNYLDYHGVDGLHLTQFGNDLTGAATIQFMRVNGLISNDPVIYSPAATAAGVIAAFPTALSTDEAKIVNDFVEYMDNFSIWDDIDAIVCTHFGAQNNSLHDMKGVTNPVNNGGTWTSHQGIALSGATSSRINTDFIPSTDGVNFIQNDAEYIYILTKNNHSIGVAGIHMGAIGSSTNKRVQLGQNTSGGWTWRINDNNSNSVGSAALKNGGYYRGRRNASNTSDGKENMLNSPASGTAVSICDVEVVIGCRNNNGVLDFPAAHVVGLWGFGDSTIPHTGVMRQCRNIVVSLMVL